MTGSATGIKWMEARDAAEHPKIHRTTPHNKKVFGPKYQLGNKVTKAWPDSSGQSINYLLIGVAAVTVQDMCLLHSVYHTDIVYLFLNNIRRYTCQIVPLLKMLSLLPD